MVTKTNYATHGVRLGFRAIKSVYEERINCNSRFGDTRTTSFLHRTILSYKKNFLHRESAYIKLALLIEKEDHCL